VIRYSDDEMLAALARVGAELGETPSLDAYNARRAEGEPSGKGIVFRFGTWTGAVDLAGLEPRRPGPSGAQKYTDDDLLDAISRVRARVGHDPLQREYVAHKRARDPSLQAIVLRYTSWFEAVERERRRG
jgi:hypothetical protein